MRYPDTRLPQIGTTIFARISTLAQAHRALNLSQGFPDFDGPETLPVRFCFAKNETTLDRAAERLCNL
jgi:methionine aminotransferase